MPYTLQGLGVEPEEAVVTVGPAVAEEGFFQRNWKILALIGIGGVLAYTFWQRRSSVEIVSARSPEEMEI